MEHHQKHLRAFAEARKLGHRRLDIANYWAKMSRECGDLAREMRDLAVSAYETAEREAAAYARLLPPDPMDRVTTEILQELERRDEAGA